MSYYINFYLGYKEKGKIYPLGPYDYTGRLRPVLTINGYYDCDIIDDFEVIKSIKRSVSQKALVEIYGEDYKISSDDIMRVLDVKDLPEGSHIKKGYFPVDIIRDYEENGCYGDLFGGISQLEYANLLENELKFGKPKREQNEFGEWYIPMSASDYMYYMYEDFNCKEFHARVIKDALNNIYNYLDKKDVLVFTTEG